MIYSLRPSPRKESYDTRNLRDHTTFRAIQDLKRIGFRLKGSLFLEDGRTRLIFYEENIRKDIYKIAIRTVRIRSFSSFQ